MACSKYTLTNTGSTIVNFNYQRCDDAMWEYQVELTPNQTKNIWLLNGTYSTAFPTSIVEVDLGVFPPLKATPTPTPTPSVTASITPTPSVTATITATPTNTQTPTNTNTETPTNTPTNTSTQTPTNTASETPTNTPTNTATQTPTQTNTNTPTNTPTNTATSTPTPSPTDPQPARYAFSVPHNESSSEEACDSTVDASLFGNDPVFSNNTFFYGCSSGLCPDVNLSGYYVYDGDVYELNSGGTVGAITVCLATPTPTPTSSLTPTPTLTPTSTPTYVVYSLGTGATSNDACIASPQNIFGSAAQADGPDVSETLYTNSGLSLFAPNGYYSNGTRFYQVTGGSGLITASNLC